MSRWEIIKEPLDDYDIVETLAEKIHGIEFESAAGDSVYPAVVEKNSNNSILVTMSDGTKFELICNKL